MSLPEVAIDGRRLQDRPLGGVGRGIACMLPHLRDHCRPTVLTDASRQPPERPSDVPVVALPRLPGTPEAAWLHWSARRWSRRAPRHVFHGTFNAIPAGLRGPSVVTIHDLTFELHPEDFAPLRRRAMRHWFRLNARYAAAHADAVITVSRFSADLIAEHYGVADDRLVVIPNAADPCFSPDAATGAPSLTERLGIRRPYLVTVGGAPRRGADVSVAAWQLLRRRGDEVDLVVVGHAEAPDQSGLHRVSGLSDDEWASLLAGAAALSYPTRYEGFGLPGLEATACGTPVVAVPTTSLPEVLGDAAAWCADPGPEAVAEQLGRILHDAAHAADLRARGLAHAAAWPTWADVARRHADLYAAVI